MSHLFAEAFAEPLQDPTRPPVEHRYDEALGLSVLADGRVFVEHASIGETQTGTKAVGEQDDEDPTTISQTDAQVDNWRGAIDGTHTAVKAEADDWASTRGDNETVTLVRGEGDDWASSSQLDTSTRVRGEVDDWA
jgi:hypothetical protein